jgi:hypothetical protein
LNIVAFKISVVAYPQTLNFHCALMLLLLLLLLMLMLLQLQPQRQRCAL